MTAPLTAHQLTAAADLTYRGRRQHLPIVEPADLTLHGGQVHALIGESGCGKSMIARALIGLPPDGVTMSGQVTIRGSRLNPGQPAGWQHVRGHQIGYVPQSTSTAFSPSATIGTQLRQVCRTLRADRTPHELVAAVALPSTALQQYPHELSGGMSQRAAVAAAIAGRPDIVVADEPTSALDPALSGHTWQLLGELARTGTAVLVITHDMAAMHQCEVVDKVTVMRSGRIVATSTPAELTTSSDPYLAAFGEEPVPC